MSIKKLLGMVCAALISCSLIAADVVLKADHPDRYVVVKGDTLWDISSMFLRDAWLWPEIWYVNPQIANPHLIYPGDILTLVYVDGKPQLRLQRGYPTVKYGPHARVESLEGAIPTIPLDAIAPFLTRPLVVGENELDSAPYIVQGADDHVVTGAGDRVYVQGIEDQEVGLFDIYRPGDAYIDPDTQEVLGYEALWVGTSAVEHYGDVEASTLLLTETNREARTGDRLRPAETRVPFTHFTPRAPETEIEARVIALHDAVAQVGQYQIVAINRGSEDGLETGHVLKIYRAGELIRDPVLRKRNATVQLPDEESGLMMVFRTFDRVSFALIMHATKAIHLLDFARTP